MSHQVNIIHKISKNKNQIELYHNKLIAAELLTKVHHRLTDKYSSFPISVVYTGDQNRYYSNDEDGMLGMHYITIYYDDNINLPGKIDKALNSMTDAEITKGICPAIIYLGEISPTFNIHAFFKREDHLGKAKINNYAYGNQNEFVLVSDVNKKDTIDQFLHMIKDTNSQKTGALSNSVAYNIGEYSDALNLYRKIMNLISIHGEIRALDLLLAHSKTIFTLNDTVLNWPKENS